MVGGSVLGLGSMLGLLGRGARLHGFYLFALVVAKGFADVDSSTLPVGSSRLGAEPPLLDFGLIVTGSGGGDLFVGGLVRGGRFFDDSRPWVSGLSSSTGRAAGQGRSRF